MRRAWWGAALAAAIAVSVLVVLVANRDSDPSLPDTASTSPVLVGTVDIRVTRATPGVYVFATIRVRADRRLPIDRIQVAVRNEQGREVDPAGRALDLPADGPLTLTDKARTLRSAGPVRTAGRYTYFLRYTVDGRTRTLPPVQSFTFR